jgi:threonine dehydratase
MLLECADMRVASQASETCQQPLVHNTNTFTIRLVVASCYHLMLNASKHCSYHVVVIVGAGGMALGALAAGVVDHMENHLIEVDPQAANTLRTKSNWRFEGLDLKL